MDQDLINYAQTVVKIHKLPKEWLWCEAWCEEEDKFNAKIIDFCTDPFKLTESKYEKAQRLIPEFDDNFGKLKSLMNKD